MLLCAYVGVGNGKIRDKWRSVIAGGTEYVAGFVRLTVSESVVWPFGLTTTPMAAGSSGRAVLVG